MSDRGANIIKALEGHDVVFCFGHRMNNVLQRSFYQTSCKQYREPDTNGTRTASKRPLNILDSSDEDLAEGDDDITKKPSPSKQPEATISLTDLPNRAKDLLEVISASKTLVKYVKLVCFYYF